MDNIDDKHATKNDKDTKQPNDVTANAIQELSQGNRHQAENMTRLMSELMEEKTSNNQHEIMKASFLKHCFESAEKDLNNNGVVDGESFLNKL